MRISAAAAFAVALLSAVSAAVAQTAPTPVAPTPTVGGAVAPPPAVSVPPPPTPVVAPTPSVFKRGMGAYRLGDSDKALTLLKAAVKEDPKNGEAESVLGYLLVKSGDPKSAIPHLERAVALRPTVADAYTNLGNALLLLPGHTSEDTERAVVMFEKAAALSPNSAEAQLSLGFACARTGRYDRAAAAYKRATEIRPKDGKAWTNLGLALRRQNQTADAAEALQKGTTYAPQDPVAWNALGEIQLDQGDANAAINSLETSRKLDSQSYIAALDLAKAYAAAGRFADSGDTFGTAADLAEAAGQADAALRYNQGVSLTKVGRTDDAGVAYEKALVINPRYYDALLNSGYTFFKQGKSEQAVTRFKTATEVEPGSALAWKNLAAAQTRLKAWPETAAAWKHVATLEPKNYPAREAEAAALMNINHLDEAAPIYRQMASLRPTSPDPLIALGLIFQRQADALSLGMPQKQVKLNAALQAFLDAIRRDPKSAVAYNNLGVTRERRGERQEAVVAYRKAISADPTLTDARKNLARYTPSGLLREQAAAPSAVPASAGKKRP